MYLVSVGDSGFEHDGVVRRILQKCHRVAGLVKRWTIVIQILNSDQHHSISGLQSVINLGRLQRGRFFENRQ